MLHTGTQSSSHSCFRRSAAGICAFVLLCGVLIFTASCFKRESAVERGTREQILHRGIGPDIVSLDPVMATGIAEYNVLTALLEGLVTENPVTLAPEPGVAEGWHIKDDGLTYTFFIRKNAVWSNGDPVTAMDFIGSFRRILTPAMAAERASSLYIIQNAEAYHKGQLTDFAQVGLSAPDPKVLRITLEHPSATFLSMLNATPFLPVHMANVEKWGAADSLSNDWARPGRFVGNGPFELVEWKRGQKITVIKSKTYWDAANVRLNGIVFHAIENRDAEERAFRSGQLHLTETIPPVKIDTYRRAGSTQLRMDPYVGTEFYRINTPRPFLNDPRVRNALMRAIDRTTIVEKILRGNQQPAYTFTPPGLGDYVPPVPDMQNRYDDARALLTAAGYSGGKGAPTIEITFNTSESHRAVAEVIQETWRRELGLNVSLVNQEYQTLLTARKAGDYQVLRSAWIADYMDPLSFLNVWTTSSADNFTGWSDRAYDQLLYQAARTADPAARNTLMRRAEALLLENAPIIPIYHYNHVFLIHPDVKNWHPTLLDHHPYKSVYLEASETK